LIVEALACAFTKLYSVFVDFWQYIANAAMPYGSSMSFIAELRRRNVIRMAVAYLAVAWVVIEVSNTILPLFGVGPGVSRLIVLGFAIGFVPVLVFTWAFEFTPEGIKLDKDVDRSAPQVIAAGKRLDRIVIALLGLALAWFAFDKFVLAPKRESALTETVRQQAASEAQEQIKSQEFDRSIVILPFANASGDAGNDYLSAGLSDELRDRLAQTPGLRVIARSSSIRVGEQNLDMAGIASQLGVSRVIEGRFNRQGNRVVLSVQLIDAVSSFQLWSHTFETASRDLLVMQQDLAREVVGQLLPELVQQVAAQTPSEQQVSAHDFLLLGRQYEQQVTDQQLVDEAKLQKAIDYYRQATLADPQSAEAQARLGKMLLYLGDIDAAEAPIFKSLELDPRLSDAHATLGLYYWITRQPGIGAAYLRAIEMNPNNADALSYYASWLWLQGNNGGAVEYYRKALQVDPASLVRFADLGYTVAFQGDTESATEVRSIITRILELFPSAAGYLAAARIAEAYGMPDEAIAYALKARILRPDDPDISGQLAEMHARIGDFESAKLFEPDPGMGQLFWQRRYPEMIDLGEELVIDQPDDVDVVFLLAFALNTQGRFEESLRLLDYVGMPETALSESRRANEVHALLTMFGAMVAEGDIEHAVALADWHKKLAEKFIATTRQDHSWATHVSLACALAVLDKDDAALKQLELLPTIAPIVWMPWLKDQTCFQKYADEPRYQAVVDAMEARLAAIRERLPATLASQGLLDAPRGSK